MKIRIDVVFLFVIGFSVGLTVFTVNRITESGYSRNAHTVNEIRNFRKIRLLCFIATTKKYFRRRAIHVRETWSQHCDKLVFTSQTTDDRLGSIGLNVTFDDYEHLWVLNFTYLFIITLNATKYKRD